jgi:hypothetical protein
MFFLVGNGKEKHASAAASGGYFPGKAGRRPPTQCSKIFLGGKDERGGLFFWPSFQALYAEPSFN